MATDAPPRGDGLGTALVFGYFFLAPVIFAAVAIFGKIAWQLWRDGKSFGNIADVEHAVALVGENLFGGDAAATVRRLYCVGFLATELLLWAAGGDSFGIAAIQARLLVLVVYSPFAVG